MITRHKIPTVFSIYMIDVLCCALGCIVLLWQVSYQEAEERAEGNLSLSGELASLKASLEDSHKKYVQISVELDKTKLERDQQAQLALVRKQDWDALKKLHAADLATLANVRLDLKDLQSKQALTAAQLADKIKAFAAAEMLIAGLKIEVKELQKKGTLSAAELLDKLKDNADLLAKLAKADARVVLLEKDVNAKALELILAAKNAATQSTKLKDADAQVLKLEKQLLDLRGVGNDALARLKIADLRLKLLEQEGDRGKTELNDNKRRLQLLMTEQDVLSRRLLSTGKDLADARAMIASLEGEKISLQNRARNIQAAAENRFAGITLTGKKVVFLVDMSGSMELTDNDTIDPDKWPLVCETIGRLLQSLTDLRHYQVILFSDKYLYPLGSQRRWLEYTGPEMAKQTVATLKSIKPKGGTNIFDAMNEAFQFRLQGLDTIYFLSDGLPNEGPGLPPQADNLNEQQKTELLARHVRQQLKSNWNRYQAGQPRVRINTIGFFFESPEVGAFLWALAREHDGSFVGMSK